MEYLNTKIYVTTLPLESSYIKDTRHKYSVYNKGFSHNLKEESEGSVSSRVPSYKWTKMFQRMWNFILATVMNSRLNCRCSHRSKHYLLSKGFTHSLLSQFPSPRLKEENVRWKTIGRIRLLGTLLGVFSKLWRSTLRKVPSLKVG